MIEFLAENQTARFAVLALLFVIIVFSVYSFSRAATARSAVKERLEEASTARPTAERGQASLRSDSVQSRWTDFVNTIEKTGINLVDTRSDTLRKKLIEAGFTSPDAPKIYTAVRLVGVILMPILVIGYMFLVGNPPTLIGGYFAATIAMLFGLYIPTVYVSAKADRRRTEITNGFPDALDLMLVCVEAGLGIDTAFNRVGQEIAESHPLLAQQFGTVVLELRAGRSREDALRRMADRAGVDEIRAFATLLIQSTKLGSSVSQTLRTYAHEMREKRRLRAEEKAHRLPVLLSVPLVGCMLPTMIGVLMVPAVIRMIRIIGPALGG
ncbi:type II secretion system F family protein [Sphingomicrobium clamense]|uniref:Type II secretion system F family protein n=1 Tax=Sphingomicrobium clamense TaxID=2851013 RepID=A0ABS6V3X9_9SPHN|nr:type II secretion system F family protein [Sphingomicrobium sp. B8]MBW0144065.1 type II secretion system F family protein [Sphingomicrobium sp. B8]